MRDTRQARSTGPGVPAGRALGALIATGLVLVMAAGCRDVQTVDIPSATLSPYPSPSGSVGPSTDPSSSPSPSKDGQGPKDDPSKPRSQGQADADLTGGLEMDLSFGSLSGYPFYFGLGNEASLTWADEQGNALSLGGTVYKGTRPTGGGDFLLDIVLVGIGDAPVQLASGDGSCTVTITTATSHGIRGRYDCPSLKLPDGRSVAMSGDFAGRIPK